MNDNVEELLLKYFLGLTYPIPMDITPINIDNQTISTTQMAINRKTYVTPDNAYFIRYGGSPLADGYNSIDVYDSNALENKTPLYEFNDLLINGHTFEIRDLRQDEDGRFYALGQYIVSDSQPTEWYLILFNNFIQDGECYIRKFYSNTTMGISEPTINALAKKKGSADYYLYANGKIYHYKIDIQLGNSLETYTYTEGGTISSGTFTYQFDIVGDNICLMELWLDDSIATATAYECKKLLIDTTKEIQSSYTTQSLVYETKGSNVLINTRIDNFNYYVIYLESSGNNYKLKFKKFDIEGNSQAYDTRESLSSTNIHCSIANNYLFTWNSSKLSIYYFDLNDTNEIYRFLYTDFTKSFGQPVIMQKFNLVYICGLSSSSEIVYSKNIYSPGYTSLDTGNKPNFMIPQYINIYSNANDDKSIIFSRDISNRFLAGNQLTVMYNVPNYMLNGNQIKRQDVNSQTNIIVESNKKTISKNRFESLNLSNTYNLYVIDNMNENNIQNQIGSNRIANSVWKALDYRDIACLRLRVTYDDLSQEILELTRSQITGTSYTFTHELTGNIIKLEYLSKDLQTVYATYNCNLTGTNTIEQTITVSSN